MIHNDFVSKRAEKKGAMDVYDFAHTLNGGAKSVTTKPKYLHRPGITLRASLLTLVRTYYAFHP